MDFWGHQRSNANIIINSGLRIINDFVNWIRVMQAFDGEF